MGIAVIIGAWVEATQEANCEPMNYSTKSNTDHIRSWYAATAHTLPNCPTLEESIAAASKPPHADDLHRYYDHLRRKYADMDPDAITRSKMREHTDTSIYFGGLLDRSAGQLHSRLAGKIMPINNYIIATEPLLETSRPETGSRERCRCGYPFCGQLLPTQYGHPPALWRWQELPAAGQRRYLLCARLLWSRGRDGRLLWPPCGSGYHRNNEGLPPVCSPAPAAFSRWDTVRLARACRRHGVLQPSRPTLRGSVLSNLRTT